MAIPGSLGMAALAAQSDDATLDALEATAAGKLAEAGDEEAAGIRARLDDLADLRAGGREAAQARLDAAQAAAKRLADSLVAWIQTPDWSVSERYLAEHAAELLSDDGESALDLLQLGNPGNEQIPMHRQLLRFAREQGIDAAYAQLRRELAQARGLEELGELEEAAQALAQHPLLQAVVELLQAGDEAAARQVLAERRDLLLTLDARDILQQFVAAARQQGDSAATNHLLARYELWNKAWRGRVQGPLRQPAGEWQEQPQSQRVEQMDHAAQTAERGSQITVVTARNSAIGPGATVFNIVNVGKLPLKWRFPRQTRPDLARDAVGREAELAELHARLTREGAAAVLGIGAIPAAAGAAAVRGLPGVGKTVLAALYANRYADYYPGGLIWLDIGPSKRTAESVTSTLKDLAAFAYEDPIQAQAMLENCLLEPDIVQALLRGHGRLLIVLDDIWSEEVVQVLKAAAPAESCLLLTTRDYDVAFSLEEGAGAIQSLDVLSEADARLLLQSKTPDLSAALADKIAQGLGYHALALTLAAAALARRKPHRHQETAQEILERVRLGRGFGDLPRLDKAERQQLSRVEIILKYSYDTLGEGANGPLNQAWFRALGTFAQEASFEREAAAALWEASPVTAEEFLLLLDGLGLVQEIEQDPAGFETLQGLALARWQQHAILRAYALSLQTEEERLALAECHADYYTNLARACYDSRPRDYERLETEFKQIEQAFAWCQEFGPARAVQLANLLNDFMRNRGRAGQLGGWLQAALAAAQKVGDRLGKANTLQSLGDLERRLGNIDQARQHYDDALPLYEAEQARLGKANTLKSLGDLESRLGNIDQARQHYDDALPLYEAEQARLGKANTLKSLGDLESRLGNIDQARQHYDDALRLYELERDPVGRMNVFIGQARMAANQANFDSARAFFERVFAIAEQIGFANHPITQDLRREYDALGIMPQDPAVQEVLRQAASDPLALALSALLGIDSDQALLQTLSDHPILAEAEALFALAGMIDQALKQQQSEAAARLVLFLALVLEQYNRAHTEEIDLETHQAVIDLFDQVISLAEQIDAELAAMLRRQAGWACNMLGNHFADQGKDLEQAVAAYTRGLAFDPANAMILRNRAGVHIDRRDRVAAQGDIDAAAALEPDAGRLAELRAGLEAL